LWVDLFCGCGGITEGYSQVQNNFIVGCVNHDRYAIKSHHKNHPHCIHYTEDIRDWNVIRKIEDLITALRDSFPAAIIGLHASLECTHFSKAKGGESRDADSRTLGDHLEKYLCFRPDYITIENVVEFLTWGPLYQVSNENGEWRYKSKKGRTVWLDFSFQENNDPAKISGLDPYMLPIKERKGELYDKWKSVFIDNDYSYDYRILNAADFGEYTSRKRYFSCFALNGLPISFPAPTHITRKKHHLSPHLKIHNAVKDKLNLQNEGVSIFGLNKTGKPYVPATFWRVYYGLLKFYNEGCFTIRYNGGDMSNKNRSVHEPLGCILTNNTHSLIRPVFMTSYYGASKDGNGVHSIQEPCNTLTTKDRFALHHLQYAYGKPTYSWIDDPSQSITTNPKNELVTTKWLFDTQFKNIGSSLNRPCPTIIARQDKKPLYLASTSSVTRFVDNSVMTPSDDEVKARLRLFMRTHGITDVLIRSLELDELKRIQGFPDDYILEGGKTRAMKYIGNSVCPGQARANAESLYEGIKKITNGIN